MREGPVTALVDADAGLGHPAGVMGMELAIKKALSMGIGAVSVFNSHHFGAAGYYAELAANKGLIGLVTSSARTVCVVPFVLEPIGSAGALENAAGVIPAAG